MMNRRSFLRMGAGAPLAARLASARSAGTPSRHLRLASFGANGMAYYTLDGIARHADVTLACVAEVDSTRLDKLKQKFPACGSMTTGAGCSTRNTATSTFACIGTPDHMHAPMAMSAMERGLHVYVQKPLTHDIHEARQLAAMARKRKLVTQMGIQIHSTPRVPHGGGLDSGRSDRQGEGGSLLEQQEVGRSGADARPQRSGAGRAQLGPVAGGCRGASLHWRRILSSGQLAQAHRFRHIDFRRHGLPHFRPGVRLFAIDRAGFRALRRAGTEPAQLGHQRHHSLRLSGYPVH